MNALALAIFFSAVVLFIAITGCGTPGVPLPPSLNLPKPVEDLQAVRRENTVFLSWSLPQENTDGTPVRRLGPALICRVLNRPQMQTCEAVKQIPIPGGKKPPATLNVADSLPPNLIASRQYATYAVVIENSGGRSAGLSNQVMVPLAPISQPQNLSWQQTLRDAIVLVGKIALSPSDAEEERFILRRQEQGVDKWTVVSEVPRRAAQGTALLEFRDENFEWDKTYIYQLVTASSTAPPDGKKLQFESDPTPPLKITPQDVFPPAIPTGVQAVYSGAVQPTENFIDLTWNPNTERDLAGYNVYRREESQLPDAAIKINTELVRTPAFRDSRIEKGKRYFYSVSAVDLHNNESPRSTEASEVVPQ